MITLITGLPGNGKTLYSLHWLRERAEKEGRQVYYSGIADLKLPWIEHDPQEWHKLPAGSIIIIDEVQRVMRPRQHGSAVPPFIAALETHRHLGVDLVLITQHPMLLDSNVRRLVGQHFHVVRKFGMQRATIHEWNAVRESCDKNRADSIRHEWAYPKDVYSLYKSAELHTHKARVPMRVWLLLMLPLLLAGLAWLFWTRVDPTRKKDVASASVAGGGGVPGAVLQADRVRLSLADYTGQYQPRVEGLTYTAAAYDQVTKPVVAPYPAACVAAVSRCQCYSQQGTKLSVGDALCRQIADGGFFVAWAQPRDRDGPVVGVRDDLPVSPQVGGHTSFGGSRTGHFTAQTQSRGEDENPPQVRRAPPLPALPGPRR